MSSACAPMARIRSGAAPAGRKPRRAIIGGSLDDLRLGDRDDELGPPRPGVRELLHDLVLEVPRQDEDVVRLLGVDLVGREARDVRTGQEPAVLVGIAIDGEVDEVGADTAVVEQGVALAGSAVAGDPLAAALGGYQELEDAALGLAHPLLERGV